LTAKADFGPGVNQNGLLDAATPLRSAPNESSQVIAFQAVASDTVTSFPGGEDVTDGGAGGRAIENGVNHAQVTVAQEVAVDIQLILGQLGVNLETSRLGRKHVFDDFLRGRLVSLLAMGLSIRQAGAALGLSHNAVWKELKRNPELKEQVTAARFQAQIEPLLVILRESKRSWRAATWVVNFLQKQIREREETPDESRERRDAEFEESIVRSEESSLAAEERRKARQQAERRRQVEEETEMLRREREQRKARKEARAAAEQTKPRSVVGVIASGGRSGSAP
jgi:hypothetical protein